MDKKFVAFISYSRKDRDIAEWLHNKLESYVLPNEDSIKNIYDFKSKYFRPVFIDLKDLHVEERPFTDEIQEALKNSSYLIVLCSKNSAISPFVKHEIEYFLQTHNNNLSRIVPLFIDEVGGNIPAPLENTSIMVRHFPIFNSHLTYKSEANNYCFYQIISYILGIDFAKIYNRYEVKAAREQTTKRKRLGLIITLLSLLLFIILGYHYAYKLRSDELLERRERQIAMEKTVFPAAVVDGYEKNFLSPVIKYLKSNSNKFLIFILMPENEKDLMHSDRVLDFEYNARQKNVVDSIYFNNLDTETKRGSRIMQIYKNGNVIDGIYIDFATTTSSFLTVADHKKKYREYKETPKDEMILEYSKEFIRQVNNRLGRDSVYVRFFTSQPEMIKELSNLNKNN